MAISGRDSVRWLIGILLVGVCVGCESAAHRAQRMEPLLSQAGFTVVQADTPARIEKLNNIKPARLSSFPVEGRQLYWFADPYVCHCVFRGTAQNYQMYQELATEQERADALDDYAQQQAYTEYMSGAANQVFYGQ
jgi:hypothetical protein